MKIRWGIVVSCLVLAAWASPLSPEQRVNFSFDRVDVRVLAKLVGDLTGRRLVVDPAVSGTVTVISPSPVAVSEIWPLFVTILEAHGLAAVEKEGVVRIFPLPERTVAPGTVAGINQAVPEVGLVTRILRVQHINVLDLKRIIDPLVRGAKVGSVSVFPPSNHLVITDTADTVRQIERIVQELDKPGAAATAEFIALKHAAAAEVAAGLMSAMKGLESAGVSLTRRMQQVAEGGAALPAEVAVIPAPWANGLVLVGAPVQIAELKRIVSMMDVEPEAGHGRLHAVFLKYLSAEEAAKNLNALLAKATGQGERPRIAIEPNISNNALIIEASAQDFALVRGLLEQLDQVPQQVLVEVLIAEVGLDKHLDFGVEWATIEAPKSGRTVAIGRSRPGDRDAIMDLVTEGLFPQGLSIGVARGTTVDSEGRIVPRMPFLVRALAQNRDVRILSSVPLWAQNNTEATLSVVNNIPVLRSTIEGGSGTARDIIQNIDRVDVGIKLKLTPHVNPQGEVLMQLNPSIEAIIDEGPPGKYSPTIARREVSTTVTVPDKATVIISGLIREDKIKAVNKVPILGDIPILGYAFRYQATRKQRTNLLIFVTPHIVTDIQEAMRLRTSLEQRAGVEAGTGVRAE